MSWFNCISWFSYTSWFKRNEYLIALWFNVILAVLNTIFAAHPMNVILGCSGFFCGGVMFALWWDERLKRKFGKDKRDEFI